VSVFLAVGAGFVVAWALWRALPVPFGNPVLLRENYRGASIPTAIGVVIVLTMVALTAIGAMAEAFGWWDEPVTATSRRIVLPAVLGFGFLGLFDDLAGAGHHRGFGGHAAALAKGSVTSGMLKLFGGALIAIAVVAGIPRVPHAGWLLLDAAVVALAANLANLLDRAPGRTTKVAAVGFAVLALATRRWDLLSGPAIALGAAGALLGPELRERGMLGDTGANALGAAIGVGVVLAVPRPGRVAVLAGLLALNLASEWISFSRVIEAVAPLRWFDHLGSRRG
jgi:UDP-N-acetylmuramyl pentapeptide phosphotransferase/UDP-N-acetylglucosamine-1-phosphate transferase